MNYKGNRVLLPKNDVDTIFSSQMRCYTIYKFYFNINSEEEKLQRCASEL